MSIGARGCLQSPCSGRSIDRVSAPILPKAPTAPKAPTGIVYDGTSSSSQDKTDQKLAFEAKKRRGTLDDMRSIARAKPQESKLYDHKMGGNAHVIIEARRRDGSVQDWLVCDVSLGAQSDGTPELMIVIPCPVCVLERGRVAETMLVRQSNRAWSLDDTDKGKIWVNPNDPKEVYVLAGTVSTHERIQCGKCRSSYQIENSVMKKVWGRR